MQKIKNKIYRYDRNIILFHFVSFLITLRLFYSGKIVGGGEAGAAFYNLSRMFDMGKTTWVDMYLGIYTGLGFASSPFFGTLAFLQRLGVYSFVLQAGFFYTVLFLTLYGAYKYSGELIEKLSAQASVVAAFFYLFNLYGIANVWNRFLPNLILFYAILPLLLYYYLKAIKNLKFKYVGVLTLLTVLFSYAFSAPAQTIILFGVILLTTFIFSIRDKRWKKRFLFFWGFIVLFSVVNFWWFSQQFYFRFSSNYDSVETVYFNPLGNIDTFEALSERLGNINDLLLLKHANFYKDVEGYYNNWPRIYNSSLVDLLGYCLVVVSLYGLLKRTKQKGVYLSFAIFVLGVFLAKGNAAPLGDIFNFVFRKITFLQFFRNPFEKLGLLIVVGLAPLVALGIDLLIKSKKKIYFIAFLIFLIYGYPFYSGLIFTGNIDPANNPNIGIKVEPPGFYRDLDEWLEEQSDEYRLLVLPLGGEGIFYDWPYGYVGVEQSGILFEKAGISHSTTIPYYGDIANELEEIVLENDDFYKATQLLNVKYVIYRPDVLYRRSYLRNPDIIKNRLDYVFENTDVFSDRKQFGRLTAYVISDQYLAPKMYITNSYALDNFPNIGDALKVNSNALVNAKLADRYDINKLALKGQIYSPFSNVLIESNSGIYKYSDEPNILPYVTKLPNNKSYNFVLIKDKIVRELITDIDEQLEYDITMLGKRVGEIKLAFDSNKKGLINGILTQYDKQFDDLLENIVKYSRKPMIPEAVWRRGYLELVFGTNMRVLKDVKQKSDGGEDYYENLSNTIDNIVKRGEELYVFGKNKFYDFDEYSRVNEYEFQNIPAGEYKVVFPKLAYCSGSVASEYLLMINEGDLIQGDAVEGDLVFSMELNQGSTTLSLLTKQIGNLYKGSDQIEINSDSSGEYVYEIDNFCPGLSYKLSVNYYVRAGYSPVLSFRQDNDRDVEGKYDRSFERRLPQGNYWFDTQNYEIIVGSKKSADKAYVGLSVEAWSNCSELGDSFEKCDDEEYKKINSRRSESVVSEIGISLFDYPEPYLVEKKQDVKLDFETVDYKRVSPFQFDIEINKIDSPKILVLSESFNGAWELTDLDEPHFMVNAYANGWLIQPGDEGKYEIYFRPQKLLDYGYIVSIVSIGVMVVYLVFAKNE